MKKIIGLILVLLIASCEKDILDNDDWVLYAIPKGEHKQLWCPLPHIGNKLSFEFKTDNTWLQSAPESGVNKICGFSYGSVHENSIRLGWEYDQELINIYAYTYVNGERFYYNIGTIEPNKTYACNIEKNKDNYEIKINNIIYNCKAAGWLPGDVLLPYIGGIGTFENSWNCWLKIER
jgi:hypothetical protein